MKQKKQNSVYFTTTWDVRMGAVLVILCKGQDHTYM